MKISPRFEEALVYANRLHAGQIRKGSGVPYISHLLGVAALVMEDGGSEDEAIAALLHDAAEDHGGRKRLEEIRGKFGTRISQMVADLSDTFERPKPDWRERKTAYLEHLPQASPSVLRVSLADKLHNARSILADFNRVGDEIWERFHGRRTGTLWYYRALVDTFERHCTSAMVSELREVVGKLEALQEQ